MAYPLPSEIKMLAERACEDTRLEVLDPGTMLKTDDNRILVAVRDSVTRMGLWIEVLAGSA